MAHLVDRTEDVPRAGDGSRVGDAPRTGGVPKVGEQGGCGSLIVVGTPIGNLSDFSPRGIEAFRRADAVCCEDTRVTAKLLAHIHVERPLIRCDEHVIASRAAALVERIRGGEVLAYASDAGMPAISDPGQVLVDAVRDAGLPVEVVPGPVACVTALVASGIPSDHFFFEGFLPRKQAQRERRLHMLAGVPGALLFYESPRRVVATLESIARVFPERQVAVCRELTKLHEEVIRDSAAGLYELMRQRETIKGEIVVVVAPPSEVALTFMMAHVADGSPAADGTGQAPGDAGLVAGDAGRASCDAGQGAAKRVVGAAPRLAGVSDEDMTSRLRDDIARALREGESASKIAKLLSQRYSRRKREVYDLVLEIQNQERPR